MSLSYLVSTAGHAQAQNDDYPHDITSITQLIREGARELGDRSVVGFAVPSTKVEGEWECERYSYKQLIQLSQSFAQALLPQLGPLEKHERGGENQIVSLLCPTGIDFLVAWIGCMGLGLGVVFVAPQCSPTAIVHLLQSTRSTHLLYHPHYTTLANSTKPFHSTPLIPLPSSSTLTQTSIESDPTFPPSPPFPTDISHIFHTSGTSGTPKPIPQSHSSSVTALPRRPLGHKDTRESAFTTTPLFHGGVSDLLRAWMARSRLFLYPSSTSAITAGSIVSAVDACQSSILTTARGNTNHSQGPSEDDEDDVDGKITSFLSVPYILTLLSPSADPSDKSHGTEMLASMDLVSTGGAPLDKSVGDGLVRSGVRLVSRLGSSECGFLLTSYRDFEGDKEWEWLHNDSPYSSALVFEPFEADEQGEGRGRKAEMIVTSDWKSKVKSNRPDGSYATGDLYEKHETKPNVWKYAGRGDDVLVMSNGEKMSPGPIEGILRSSPLVADVLVVGADRPQIACLVFPSTFPPPKNLVEQLEPLIKEANDQSPSHAQLGSEMCLVIEDEKLAGSLPKSSKGTIQRGVAYDTFRDQIIGIYGERGTDDSDKLGLSGEELEGWLIQKIEGIVGDARRYKDDKIDRETDLFSWGVDSVKAARLRFAIMKDIQLGGNSLPLNVVFEYPTVQKLANLCQSLREGQSTGKKSAADQRKRMLELVDKYSSFDGPTSTGGTVELKQKTGRTFVLTGATGSLGSHILSQLSQQPKDIVDHIFCLVRGETDHAAEERVQKALHARSLNCSADRYTVLTARLGKDKLGMPVEVYERLVSETDVVIHAAWAVHFGSGLDSFESDHIKGTRNLLDLVQASSKQSRFLFCSSLASVLNTGSSELLIEEGISDSPETAIPIGYSQSKWVTEQVCRKASDAALKDRVQVLRIGQLCGDTDRGLWNEQEGWPLMLRTAATVGSLPSLAEDPSWLPVDIAARAVIDLSLNDESKPLVSHLANPQLTKWTQILDGFKKAGLTFETVKPDDWVRAIETSDADEVKNPSRKMLSMWQAAYGDAEKGNQPAAPVSTTNATKTSKSLAACEPVSAELMAKMLERWKESGFVRQ